ncbi:uncharacterized protein SAPINGB_P005992 [Magnusiomyces paraingens]|uniref:Proteasome assembly chaperone 2 n=1 Tax=Magnusiomyces paraingens TaxID=2606893 RepID=A0A5E8C4Q1_9ASCO|nr:uncharacterized protein SAPINGB_P005992 [Saprochaete ingens]VVT58010.1 unnamed protein product [Saprochaete ingens]
MTATEQIFYPALGKSLEDVQKTLNGSILVVPTVSVANVPQLAIDLLIHSLGLTLVGRLSDKYLYPFAGPRDAPSLPTPTTPISSGISTAIEVYNSPKLNLTVIQLRAPPLPNCRRAFVRSTLAPFVSQFKFSETIVAGSSNAALSEAVPPPRFKLFHKKSGPSADLAGVDSLSSRLAGLSIGKDLAGEMASEAPLSPVELPESGFTLDALVEIAALQGPSISGQSTSTGKPTLAKVCAAVIYVYEGDNFYDAHEFADRLAAVCGLDVSAVKSALPQPPKKRHATGEEPPKWVEPLSWQGVYGKEIPIGLEEGLYS